MSVYLCAECERLIDGDCYGCNQHPALDLELICDDCLAEFEEGAEDCSEGKRPPIIANHAYQTGYSYCYWKTEQLTDRSAL